MADSVGQLVAFLQEKEYRYSDLGEGSFRLRFTGENGDYTMFVHVREGQRQFVVFTHCPVKIPKGKRAVVADYINRVNYGLTLGCLEMDMDDGEVRSRVAVPIGEHPVTRDVMDRLFDTSFFLVDDWLPGMLRVAFGNESAEASYETQLAEWQGDEGDEDETEGDSQPRRTLTQLEEEISRLLGDENDEPHAQR